MHLAPHLKHDSFIYIIYIYLFIPAQVISFYDTGHKQIRKYKFNIILR